MNRALLSLSLLSPSFTDPYMDYEAKTSFSSGGYALLVYVNTMKDLQLTLHPLYCLPGQHDVVSQVLG